MTLRKSLILSLVMHIFLFGTGLVFARLAGGLFWGHRQPIMVTLVGGGEGSARVGERREKQERSSAGSEQRSQQTLFEKPSERSTMIPNGQDGQRDEAGGAVSNEGVGPHQGEAAGSPSGPASPEQWAVIVSSIERVKSYPRLARERGIQGVVHLRFRVRPQGEVDRVEVVRSSGYEILDTASVRTVYRAAPMPYVSGWIEVPIAYVLK
jgi:TonB family protein